MPGGVEHAFTICERGGRLARGSQASGDRYSVDLVISCPHGYRALGIFHTHPGGVPIPSEMDLRSAVLHGLTHVCVGVPETGVVRCYRP
jgi:proteasome lid subunit RPN8/RPN11